MAIEVAKVELKTVQDAAGLEALHRGRPIHRRPGHRRDRQDRGQRRRQRLHPHSGRPGVSPRAAQTSARAPKPNPQFPMVWSGGCDGVITPHATIFARNDKTGPADKSRLAIGTAMSAELLPEDIGRPAMVAEGRRCGQSRDARRRHRRSEGRALRPDQDAAAHHRFGARRGIARPARRLRGARLHGRVERHDRARHRGGARRGDDAEGGGDLPQPRSLFVRRVLLLRRRTDAGADRAARQQGRAPAAAIASAMR